MLSRSSMIIDVGNDTHHCDVCPKRFRLAEVQIKTEEKFDFPEKASAGCDRYCSDCSQGKNEIGTYIRKLRESKKLGLRAMAKLIGVSPTYLSMIERNKYSSPSEEKLKKISEILGCDFRGLLLRANRLDSNIMLALKRRPAELTALIVAAECLNESQIMFLVQSAKGLNNRPA